MTLHIFPWTPFSEGTFRTRPKRTTKIKPIICIISCTCKQKVEIFFVDTMWAVLDSFFNIILLIVQRNLHVMQCKLDSHVIGNFAFLSATNTFHIASNKFWDISHARLMCNQGTTYGVENRCTYIVWHLQTADCRLHLGQNSILVSLNSPQVSLFTVSSW